MVSEAWIYFWQSLFLHRGENYRFSIDLEPGSNGLKGIFFLSWKALAHHVVEYGENNSHRS